MLIFTSFDGSAVSLSADDVDEVIPGAFGELGGGCRLVFTSGRIVTVREDAGEVEATLAEARLHAFPRPDTPREPDHLPTPERTPMRFSDTVSHERRIRVVIPPDDLKRLALEAASYEVGGRPESGVCTVDFRMVPLDAPARGIGAEATVTMTFDLGADGSRWVKFPAERKPRKRIYEADGVASELTD